MIHEEYTDHVDNEKLVITVVPDYLDQSNYSASSLMSPGHTDPEIFSDQGSVLLEKSPLPKKTVEDYVVKTLKEIIALAIEKYNTYYDTKPKIYNEKKSPWMTRISFSGQSQAQRLFSERAYLPSLSEMIENCETSREIFHVMGFFYNKVLSEEIKSQVTSHYSFVSFFFEAINAKSSNDELKLFEEAMQEALDIDNEVYKKHILLVILCDPHAEVSPAKSMRKTLVESFQLFQDDSIFPIKQYKEEKEEIAKDFETVTDGFVMVYK